MARFSLLSCKKVKIFDLQNYFREECFDEEI